MRDGEWREEIEREGEGAYRMIKWENEKNREGRRWMNKNGIGGSERDGSA